MIEVVVTTGDISQTVTTNKPTPSFLQAECPPFLSPNQQRRGTGGIKCQLLYPIFNHSLEIGCQRHHQSFIGDISDVPFTN